MSWLDELEARLEQQLEVFLRANPAQEVLLEEQEARDRQARLVGQRRQLQQQVEQERQALLQLADEIRRWQERVVKARAAGATALAERAEAHQQGLMEQGRQRWQHLSALGKSFASVERDLGELDWASFEAEQALEELRRL